MANFVGAAIQIVSWSPIKRGTFLTKKSPTLTIEADHYRFISTIHLANTHTKWYLICPQVIIHDRKPRNGTYCKESIVKLLGENLQLADENVTLCLALGYQRVQRLPGTYDYKGFVATDFSLF